MTGFTMVGNQIQFDEEVFKQHQKLVCSNKKSNQEMLMKVKEKIKALKAKPLDYKFFKTLNKPFS